MGDKSLLYADSIHIAHGIDIVIPTVGQVLDNEELYNGLITMIMADPYQYKVPLDDIGILFTDLTDYDLFYMLFGNISSCDTSLIFKDLDLSKFVGTVNKETGLKRMEYLDDRNIIIDLNTHVLIVQTLLKLNMITKEINDIQSEDVAKYVIKLERKKMKRRKKNNKVDTFVSRLEPLVVTLVNTADFPYDYEGCRNISLYQFYRSYEQIIHKVNFDKVSMGIYFGTLDPKKLDDDLKTWICNPTNN